MQMEETGMNREILFKAKRTDNGEWVEGFYLERYNAFKIKEYFIFYLIKYGWIKKYKIDPDTLCQYTGLTDKNGQKIWENDIIELPGEDGYFVCEWQEDTARFVLNGEGLTVDFDNYWSYEVEVIGNIFDNPDLLEVE